MITDINNEDRLVQKTFTDHLETMHGWQNVYMKASGQTAPLAGRMSGFARSFLSRRFFRY